MEEELDWVLNDLFEDDAAMAEAGMVDADAELSEEVIDEEEVLSFKEKALATAKSFKEWIIPKVKSLTLEKALLVGTGVMLIYQLIEKHASVASNGGKKISLNSAIDGVKKVLVDKYTETVHDVAVKTKNGSQWSKLSPDVQKIIEDEIAMTGDIYWLTIAQEIMEKLAEMPIYDPTVS